ncbi:hypothetical protein PHISCL_07259 [Aspergillus sclerotialis]|uniref:Uncharacterized protein n=1 Tax=Aspergillus sclerotialis TaxID=2070753 RepID=A0A3A2ZB82_9EURO|nr:hypothetical protein PHISCL_07259 [Aspergillus sclerotialis]
MTTLAELVQAFMVVKTAINRRSRINQELAKISHLHGIPHLYEMERLISSGSVPVSMLTPQDLGLLEAIDPIQMPQTIMKAMASNQNSTIGMRIAVTMVKEMYPHAKIVEIPGNLLNAPTGSVLVHACNTWGMWGAGFARQLREKYPAAYRFYRNYCMTARRGPNGVFGLLGRCLVIPPQMADIERHHTYHWIACIFTKISPGCSSNWGATWTNTAFALEDMHIQVEALQHSGVNGLYPGKYWTCRFNAGNFNIPWSRTREILASRVPEAVVVSWNGMD